MKEKFIRLASKAERVGGIAMRRAFLSIPAAPPEYEKVFKPYGTQGAGFYYILISDREVYR